MSYSLALDANGDLRQTGSRVGIVSGVDKLRQDLDIWFKENYRVDRFHPTYGSTLDSHIGGVISALSTSQIRQEASRILANYQKVQKAAFDKNPGVFSLDELIVGVNAIKIKQSYDSVVLNIYFTTAAGTVVPLQVGASI